jgi:hypothetical protein
MNRSFQTLTSHVPITDIGVTVERTQKKKENVTLGESNIELGELKIPYDSMKSAELQIFGFRPFCTYVMSFATSTEIYSIRIPRRQITNGFPFEYETRRISTFSPGEVKYQIGLTAFCVLYILWSMFHG